MASYKGAFSTYLHVYQSHQPTWPKYHYLLNRAMVSEHLISARARLDVHTLGKSRVIRDFSSAASLVHALGDGTFVIGQLIDLFTSAVSLITQASMLWKMTTKDNADLALISVFSASITMMRVSHPSFFLL